MLKGENLSRKVTIWEKLFRSLRQRGRICLAEEEKSKEESLDSGGEAKRRLEVYSISL